MTTPEPFQRARRPEQKEERRLHLLETARMALRGGMEVSDLGLNELARQACMTKSNVYRYFENREALLLALLEEETAQWSADLAVRLGCATAVTPARIARDFARACVARPLMCRLFSILPSIIERNVSSERLTQFKRNSLELIAGVAERLHKLAPALPFAAYVQFMRLTIALMIGLWPLANPAAALAGVLELQDLRPLRYDFATDLEAGLLLLLNGGLAAPAAH
nr:TetR family transcriptional regulator [uncultured Duganella sp.]